MYSCHSVIECYNLFFWSQVKIVLLQFIKQGLDSSNVRQYFLQRQYNTFLMLQRLSNQSIALVATCSWGRFCDKIVETMLQNIHRAEHF